MLRRAPLGRELRIAWPPARRGFPSPGVYGGVSWHPADAVASRAYQLSLYHVCGAKLSMTSPTLAGCLLVMLTCCTLQV